MSEVKMLTAPVPNVPWQERPQGPQNGAPIWRYSENPIIGRNPLKGVARIFNSAVMPYGDAFIGVFRGEQTNGIPYIYLGHSKDAIHWDFEENKIPFVDENGELYANLCIRSKTCKSRRHLLYHLVSGFLRSSNRHGKNNRFQDVYTD